MNPLDNLKDIYTPAAINIWPPAYGWWLLAGIIILALWLVTVWVLKARRLRIAKRQALQALQQIEATVPNGTSQLNQLLKRVAMTYFPQQNVQKMHGMHWTDFLVKTLPTKQAKSLSPSIELMQQSLYQSDQLESSEFTLYQKSVEMWIKHALPPSKKVLNKLEQEHA